MPELLVDGVGIYYEVPGGGVTNKKEGVPTGRDALLCGTKPGSKVGRYGATVAQMA